LKDSKVYVRGDQDVTIEGNATVYAQKNLTAKVDGDMKTTVKGNYDLNVGKAFNLNVREGINVRGANIIMEANQDNIETYAAISNINYAVENYSIKSGLDTYINTNANLHILANEDGYITTSTGAINLNSKTTMNIESTADVDLKGANINLNTDGKGEADTSLEALDANKTIMAEPPEGGNVTPSATVTQEQFGVVALDDEADSGAQ